MTTQKMATLRVCMSCEWVFTHNQDTDKDGCPQCGWGHYGARYVYGGAAYRYVETQQKWLDKKMFEYECKLRQEIADSQKGSAIIMFGE